MRLIDADDLYTVCKEVAENDCLTDGAAVEVLDIVCEAMANTKTIDAVEVVHGHWRNVPPYVTFGGEWYHAQVCSVCGTHYTAPTTIPLYKHNYCAECGAKMDEVSE